MLSKENNNCINNLNKCIKDKFKDLNVLVMGGHQTWQNKLKEAYPYFNYIDTNNVNYDINKTRNADIIFFNIRYCSHTLFYKIKNNVNNGRSNRKDKLIFIESNSLNHFKKIVNQTLLKSKI